VSWADHRLLVREASANVIAELRTNKQELDGLFASLEQEKAQLEHADEVADLLLAHKPLEHITMVLESHGAELKNAAVTTGQITGAFGYMEYSDVRRYADVYDLQAQYMRLQEREDQHFSDVLAFVRRIPAPVAPNADALLRWKSQIDVACRPDLARAAGRQLQKRYDELLSGSNSATSTPYEALCGSRITAKTGPATSGRPNSSKPEHDERSLADRSSDDANRRAHTPPTRTAEHTSRAPRLCDGTGFRTSWQARSRHPQARPPPARPANARRRRRAYSESQMLARPSFR
jgi:hypothetical protein